MAATGKAGLKSFTSNVGEVMDILDEKEQQYCLPWNPVPHHKTKSPPLAQWSFPNDESK